MRDRIGEAVNPSEIPICKDHQDCFANLGGKCTALTEAVSQCSFYRSNKQNQAEIRRCYARLKKLGRLDLIQKYANTLAALGAFDDEIEDMARIGAGLEEFRKQNYEETIAKAVSGELADWDETGEDEDEQYEVPDDPWDDGRS